MKSKTTLQLKSLSGLESMIERYSDERDVKFAKWLQSEEYKDLVHDFTLFGEPTDLGTMYRIYKKQNERGRHS